MFSMYNHELRNSVAQIGYELTTLKLPVRCCNILLAMFLSHCAYLLGHLSQALLQDFGGNNFGIITFIAWLDCLLRSFYAADSSVSICLMIQIALFDIYERDGFP